MLAAAEAGAQVAVVCNLVDVAQALADSLRETSTVQVDLFHARFRFMDRQGKEKGVIKNFGLGGDRSKGRILVATQVVEQSLDVDFDWLITQLCPVDLLFQRMGRLHRHEKNNDNRPAWIYRLIFVLFFCRPMTITVVQAWCMQYSGVLAD